MTSTRSIVFDMLCGICAAGFLVASATTARAAGETLKSGKFSMQLPLGLQADSAYIPEDNPLTKEMKALGLSPQEIDDLVAFLHALTGEVNNSEPPTSLPQ